ncbi:MAG TPA: hypothetical protein PKD51_03595 [Saprospiraceae bacterium]|nr:hypothetical protein [Saprospiraceae bacterium]
MSDNLKSILFIIALILISNWGAGYMASLKSEQRENSRQIESAKMGASCKDSLSEYTGNKNVK